MSAVRFRRRHSSSCPRVKGLEPRSPRAPQGAAPRCVAAHSPYRAPAASLGGAHPSAIAQRQRGPRASRRRPPPPGPIPLPGPYREMAAGPGPRSASSTPLLSALGRRRGRLRASRSRGGEKRGGGDRHRAAEGRERCRWGVAAARPAEALGWGGSRRTPPLSLPFPGRADPSGVEVTEPRPVPGGRPRSDRALSPRRQSPLRGRPLPSPHRGLGSRLRAPGQSQTPWKSPPCPRPPHSPAALLPVPLRFLFRCFK